MKNIRRIHWHMVVWVSLFKVKEYSSVLGLLSELFWVG